MKVRLVWKPGSLIRRHREDEADPPPRGLLDIRSHILWGLDDGPPSLEQSIAMLKLAAQHGTTEIVATPSASFECRFDPQIVPERLAAIRARCKGFIRIHTAWDFHFSFGNIRNALANPQCSCQSAMLLPIRNALANPQCSCQSAMLLPIRNALANPQCSCQSAMLLPIRNAL